MADLGLQSWLLYGLLFSSGASVALWADHWLRRWTDRKPDAPTNARLMLTWGDTWDVALSPGHVNIHHWYSAVQGPRVLIVIGFDAPIPDGHIQVASDAGGLRWKEEGMSDRHAVVTVDGRQAHSFIHVEVVPPSAASGRRQREGVWQDAVYLEDAGYLPAGPPRKPRLGLIRQARGEPQRDGHRSTVPAGDGRPFWDRCPGTTGKGLSGKAQPVTETAQRGRSTMDTKPGDRGGGRHRAGLAGGTAE